MKPIRSISVALRTLIHAVVVASILAGLIPPPLVATVASLALPAPVTESLTASAQALLPAPSAAKAAELSVPLAAPNNKRVESVPALPVAKGLDAPPASTGQPTPVVLGSSSITLTKSVVGSTQSSYSVTIVGPSYPSGASVPIISGTQVITGLVNGIYTITEVSPGAGWTTSYTTTTGYSTGSSAVVTLTNSITATLTGVTQITGRVFNDYNSDGLITANGVITDTGVQSVTVTAYGMNGANCGSTQSSVSGYYTLTTAILTCDGPYRIQFTNLPAGYESSRSDTQNGTTVQFVTNVGNANNVNLGVNHPADYCQENPDLCLSIAINGNPADGTAPRGVIAAVPYFAPSASVSQLPDPLGSYLANKSDVGAIWGMAYNRTNQTIYSSAYLKRHSGLREGLATNPLGAIYQTVANGTTLFVDLSTLGINVGSIADNTTRGLGAPNEPSRDSQSFEQIGKIGIGDIDIADDGRILYAMSLNDKTVYAINIANKTLVGEYPLTVLKGVNICTGGELRPFALKFYRSQLYVGTVCDASSSQTVSDLIASVYSLDLTSGLYSSVLTFPLDYVKGDVSSNCPKSTADNRLSNWNAWLDTPPTIYCTAPSSTRRLMAYPQPILADIEVDIDGSLILGLRDRTADQWGASNLHPTNVDGISYSIVSSGDILRACKRPTGFALPGSAECPNTLNNNEGPGGGEYYTGDFMEAVTGGSHREISFGGVALLPGSNQTALAAMDPNLRFASGGIKWLNNITGSAERGLEVYGNAVTGYFNKANGLGDIEILCDAAPIQIGNRVWNDLDNDGIQDAGELGINGVQVSLQSPTGTVGTVTTSGDGNYYFGNLQANTHYTITINSSPAGYSLTQANATALGGASVSSNHAISDVLDSDGVLVNNIPTIYYTTGSAGQNNHGLDFGFSKPATGQVDILNTAPPPANLQLVKAVTGGSSSDPFTVTVSGPAGYSVITTVTTSAVRTLTNLTPGTYTVTESSLPGAPSGLLWSGTIYTPTAGTISLGGGLTGVVTITNQLSPIPPNPATLIIDKVVTGGSSAGPFTMAVTGPGNFNQTVSLVPDTPVTLTNLSAGVYTVTESALPGAPVGFTWDTASYNPANGEITLSEDMTGTVTVTNPLTPTLQRFGDRLWLESDNDGDATTNFVAPVANKLITATEQSGTVYTTLTDNNGFYTFTVPAGTYTVTYGLPPVGYQPSSTPAGGVVGAAAGGNDQSHLNQTVVTLNPGEIITTVDFGFGPQLSHLTLVKTVNVSTAYAGDVVTFTLTLTNDGSGPATDVVVTDYLPATLEYITYTASSGIYSDSTGEWSLPTVPVGTETLTMTVRVK